MIPRNTIPNSPGRPFTSLDDDVIKAKKAAGTSIRRIAADVGRSPSSVHDRLNLLKRLEGVVTPTPTQDDDDMARKKSEAAEIETPAALQEIEDGETEGGADLAVETLTGDLRDFILDRVKYEQDKLPWDRRSEMEQRLMIQRTEEVVREHVIKAVELIAANGQRVIAATLEGVTIKDGIKAVLSLSKLDPQRYALFDSQGARVLIVVADADEFSGERAPAHVTPDQGDLVADAMAVHSEADTKSTTKSEVPFH